MLRLLPDLKFLLRSNRYHNYYFYGKYNAKDTAPSMKK